MSTDDTIKLNREMFRSTVDAVLGPGWSREMRDELESGLFGPPKPREWTLLVTKDGKLAYAPYSMIPGELEEVRVREILDDK